MVKVEKMAANVDALARGLSSLLARGAGGVGHGEGPFVARPSAQCRRLDVDVMFGRAAKL